MSISSDTTGQLMYVLREIVGKVERTIRKIEDGTRNKVLELVPKDRDIKEPVIVMFPNGTSQVMTLFEAESRGFTRQPAIMNFEQVQDASTAAGRYKHAMMLEQKQAAWMEMETAIINTVLSSCGKPLPDGAEISEKSFYMKVPDTSEMPELATA